MRIVANFHQLLSLCPITRFDSSMWNSIPRAIRVTDSMSININTSVDSSEPDNDSDSVNLAHPFIQSTDPSKPSRQLAIQLQRDSFALIRHLRLPETWGPAWVMEFWGALMLNRETWPVDWIGQHRIENFRCTHALDGALWFARHALNYIAFLLFASFGAPSPNSLATLASH